MRLIPCSLGSSLFHSLCSDATATQLARERLVAHVVCLWDMFCIDVSLSHVLSLCAADHVLFNCRP